MIIEFTPNDICTSLLLKDVKNNQTKLESKFRLYCKANMLQYISRFTKKSFYIIFHKQNLLIS